MNRLFKKVLLSIFIAFSILLHGCTIAAHETKNKFWAMQPDMQKLPSVSVVSKTPGYISYPLLFSRKKLFESVATCSNVFPVDIEVEVTMQGAQNVWLALPWLIVSGSSAFIIPYRADNPRHAVFTVKIHGQEVKKFEYDDVKYVWIETFGMFAGALDQENDEYYVEELMADQFVNSFIIDLYKDPELIQAIKNAK